MDFCCFTCTKMIEFVFMFHPRYLKTSNGNFVSFVAPRVYRYEQVKCKTFKTFLMPHYVKFKTKHVNEIHILLHTLL